MPGLLPGPLPVSEFPESWRGSGRALHQCPLLPSRQARAAGLWSLPLSPRGFSAPGVGWPRTSPSPFPGLEGIGVPEEGRCPLSGLAPLPGGSRGSLMLAQRGHRCLGFRSLLGGSTLVPGVTSACPSEPRGPHSDRALCLSDMASWLGTPSLCAMTGFLRCSPKLLTSAVWLVLCLGRGFRHISCDAWVLLGETSTQGHPQVRDLF